MTLSVLLAAAFTHLPIAAPIPAVMILLDIVLPAESRQGLHETGPGINAFIKPGSIQKNIDELKTKKFEKPPSLEQLSKANLTNSYSFFKDNTLECITFSRFYPRKTGILACLNHLSAQF